MMVGNTWASLWGYGETKKVAKLKTVKLLFVKVRFSLRTAEPTEYTFTTKGKLIWSYNMTI